MQKRSEVIFLRFLEVFGRIFEGFILDLVGFFIRFGEILQEFMGFV